MCLNNATPMRKKKKKKGHKTDSSCIIFFFSFLSFFSTQILIESGSRATEFEELAVDVGSSLLPDMLVDSAGEHIYTISSSKVI